MNFLWTSLKMWSISRERLKTRAPFQFFEYIVRIFVLFIYLKNRRNGYQHVVRYSISVRHTGVWYRMYRCVSRRCACRVYLEKFVSPRTIWSNDRAMVTSTKDSQSGGRSNLTKLCFDRNSNAIAHRSCLSHVIFDSPYMRLSQAR